MSLTEWLNQGKLTEHRTSGLEIKELLGVVDRDLVDCQAKDISPDWQLAIAYNAALQAANAALYATGFRAKGEGHHYRVIQSLTYTIGAKPELVAQLDSFRNKRHTSDYDRAGIVSTQEATEMFTLAKTLRDIVVEWLKENHPELMGM
jgi:uncharacterized protein (UPF0332 family)